MTVDVCARLCCSHRSLILSAADKRAETAWILDQRRRCQDHDCVDELDVALRFLGSMWWPLRMRADLAS